MLEVLLKIIINLFDVRMRVSEDESASTGEGVFAWVLKVLIITADRHRRGGMDF